MSLLVQLSWLAPTPPARHAAPALKAPARNFRLSDWYGADWDHKKPADDLWVSPWAKAHYKLRQQEIEIEGCEFLLKNAVEAEDYAEADGLKERVERLRSQHPLIPREERLAAAPEDGNFALAVIFQRDLEAVKKNLGLPKYTVGQAVMHTFREGLRGIVIDVDLTCTKGRTWVDAAGCLERGCALGYPAEETERHELVAWAQQPFYTVMLDLTGMDKLDDPGSEESEGQKGTWRWKWPTELAAWEVNHFSKTPAPVYLPEDVISHDTNDAVTPLNPELERLFDGFDSSPHRGRIYRPKPRLRLWQQQRAKNLQEVRQTRRAFDLASKNPYDEMATR